MASTTTLIYGRDILDTDKVAPQAKMVFDIVKGKGRVDRKIVVDELGKNPLFKTKQTPERIVGYYQPKLLAAGLIKVEVVTEPKPEKPAKVKAEAPAAEAPAAEAPAPVKKGKK